jgi:hypothetical protein
VVSDINVDLSRGFFEQMDILGESIHKEFIARG